MEAIPKSDIKSVIKSDIRFDISIKPTTWIGHYTQIRKPAFRIFLFFIVDENREKSTLKNS